MEKKSNQNSFWAVLSNLLIIMMIYICVFYVFNLSPSALVCTAKFWFIISNTLILIIAADYGAFSSYHNTLPFSDQNNLRRPTPNTTLPYFHMIIKYDKTTSNHHARDRDRQLIVPQEKIIGVVINASDDHGINNIPTTQKNILENCELMKKVETVDKEEEEVEVEEMVSENDVEDEFSRMSDEEVNRRVEEFIRTFNRQIRLQALKNQT